MKSLILILIACTSSISLAKGRGISECKTYEEICEAGRRQRNCVIPNWFLAEAYERVSVVPIWKSKDSCVVDHYEQRYNENP